MNKRCDMFLTIMACIATILTQVLLIAMIPTDSVAGITKVAIWNEAYGVPTCYTANERAMRQASLVIWGAPQKILNDPNRIDMFETEGGVDHIFVLDKCQRLFRYFGTKQKLLSFFINYTAGPQLKCPTGLVVQPDETASDWHKMYILDAGDSAIRAYNVNKVNHNINYSGDIYTATSNGGYGALNGARDLAYCYFYSSTCDRLLIVADTYNHRVLVMKEDGTVVHEIGGPDPGSGINQFRYPNSVAAVSLSTVNCAAFIYISDKGNNRIVCLYQDENLAIHWYKSIELPYDPWEGELGCPEVGVEDIAVDDFYKNGLWVLDSRQQGVIQYDLFLEQQIQIFRGMNYKGKNLKDLSLHSGQMAVLAPYRMDSGFELFEIRASFFNIEASPNPFDPDFEWLTLTFISSGEAYLDAWIEDSTGTTVLQDSNFAEDNFVFPQVNYLVWDGKDDSQQRVAPGLYHVHLRLTDMAWGSTELKQVSVRVKAGRVKVLATHVAIADPKWSPDGTQIAYAAGDVSPYNGRIAKLNIASLSETLLTPQEGLGDRCPSWSPAGDKIAFKRNTEYISLFDYWEAGVFVMDSDGQNVQVISDTSETLNYATDPSWIRGGKEVSYVRYHRDASPPYRILAYDMETDSTEVVYQRDDVYGIYRHLWSPLEDKIVMAKNNGLMHHLYSYDVETEINSQVTFDDEAGSDEEKSFTYSPDGKKLAFLEKLTYLSADSWKILTVPSNGGTKIPISGLSSDVVGAGTGLSWSPDGTKIAFILSFGDYDELVLADYIRDSETAFPAAFISAPFAGSDVNGIVSIVGSVAANISIDDSTTLSEPTSYRIEYGAGDNPYSWDTTGVELVSECSPGNCEITNDTLALWNTGLLKSGLYTLRLTALDGTKSNVICRCVNIRHSSITVKKSGTGDFLSIQAAIDSAQSGDTVLVYTGDYEENLVMKEAVHLIGVEDSVRIIGGNDISVRIDDHEIPCSMRNVIIRNDNDYGNAVGILIDNSSPTISDCIIQDQGYSGSAYSCGIRITGNSKPTFFNCAIRDNRAAYGAGVKITAASEVFPAPSFYGCSFIGNHAQGKGGAIYMYYTTPLDTTHVQPYFNRCVFSDNTSNDYGSALYLEYCHAPFFAYCTFLNNRPSTGNGNPIFGLHSGARFTNCTFEDNAGEGYAAVVHLGYLQSLGNDALRADNCIFAYNELQAIEADTSHCDVNNSCFYSNAAVDSVWLDCGVGNFQSDPAFCDRENDDLHLYSFSPCSPAVSGVELIGAYGVDCVPHVDSLVCNNPNIDACPPNSCSDNPTLYVCPAGDSQALVVHVDLADSEMTRDISAEEIELIPPSNPYLKFLCDSSICADSAATSSNGWRTTITDSIISARGSDSIQVRLDGIAIGSFNVAFKSPDYTGSTSDGSPDGKVTLADLIPFGETWQKCKGMTGYIDAFNFALSPNDTCVNLTDFCQWGVHWQCMAPCIETAARTTAKSQSDVALELLAQLEIIDKEKYLNIGVNLIGARSIVSACLALDGDKYGLEFLSWEENAVQEGTIMAAPISKNGSDRLLICMVAEKGTQADSVCLGTARYRMKSTESPAANDRIEYGEMSLLAFGEALTSGGATIGMANAGIEIQGEVAKYYNYLRNCYPNPFNPSTTIEYSIARDSHVKLSIYNVNGQLVRELVNEKQKKNVYSVLWNGRDNRGKTVAAGIYFCRLKSDFFEDSRKLILLR